MSLFYLKKKKIVEGSKCDKEWQKMLWGEHAEI